MKSPAYVFNPFRPLLLSSEKPPSLAKGRSLVNISKLYLLLTSNSSPLGTKRGMNFTANSGERKGSLKSLLFGPNPNFLFCSYTRAFRTLRLRLGRSHLPSSEGRSYDCISKLYFYSNQIALHCAKSPSMTLHKTIRAQQPTFGFNPFRLLLSTFNLEH